MQQMTEAGLLGSQNGFRYVLSRPAFRLVWFAQVASQTADKFVMFSLIILAYKVTGASTNVAITLLAYTLPALFIPPFAGVFADRHNRKNIMVWANVGRGAAVALIPIVALWPPIRGDVLHLLLITFLFSSLGQLFSPAEAAAIPSLLPKRALLTANSMVMITMVLTLLVGGALAPLAARIDAYLPYWIASGFFVLSALLILFSDIPRNQPAREQTSRNAARQLITELYEALAFLRASAVLMSSFAQLSLAVLVLFMMFTLAPAYVSTVVGIQAQDSYVILLPATIGAMLSALALGQFGRHAKRSRLLVGSLVATGLTLIALASVPFAMRHVPGLADYTRDFAAVFAFVLGVEFGFLMIPSLTYLQEHTTDEIRGRIFSLFFMAYNGATALPVLLAAALADIFGTGRVIGGLGVALAVTGAAVASGASRVYGPEEN
ncbi:MAG: MFS transporter [Chloroflexi bacterium]|nr:MAG: MFS transporter [Chloroflexota bacterium]TME17741.1 MAG: MFS transporter [Chloroflexota bacterium]TME18258.1 MAG: MFS transporter [Chloroflexota bacterium]